LFDFGFRGAEHEAFMHEFNQAPFRDPLSVKALAAFKAGDGGTVTALRRDLVDDAVWYSSSSVEQFRRTAQVDDCLISVQSGVQAEVEGGVMVLCAFRKWGDANRFGSRERVMVDTLHRGLEWMYRAEGSFQRVTRATSLSPRLRETLEFLLGGDTERQVAARMSLSIHTVHDYVKALYVHFGVSSRRELMARWIQSGEKLPGENREG